VVGHERALVDARAELTQLKPQVAASKAKAAELAEQVADLERQVAEAGVRAGALREGRAAAEAALRSAHQRAEGEQRQLSARLDAATQQMVLQVLYDI
jgi:chromosome segregation ATPase